jgi:transcriptional regulator with XRE-family HTH domain
VSKTLGERLAQARREKGVREWRDLARTEIAEACGVDPSMISLYELGKNVPREDALTKLADFLGVTPAYLRYGVESPREPEVIPASMFVDAPTSRSIAAKAAAEKAAAKKRRA